ncbi:MAG: hypothetical protein V7682_02860 [Cycloclasticus sp.]
MAIKNVVKSFLVEVFNGKKMDAEPEYTFQGENDEWLEYQNLRLQGFDGSISIQLENIWREVLNQQKSYFIAPVVGYETIIKFGNTMQIKTPFTVKISISYT